VKSSDLMASLSTVLKKKAKKSDSISTSTTFKINNYNIVSEAADDLASGLSCQSVEFRAQSAKPQSPAQAEPLSPTKTAQENKQQNQPQNPVHKGSVRWAKYKNRPQQPVNVPVAAVAPPKKENARENKRRPLKNAVQPTTNNTFSNQSTSSSDPKKVPGELGFQFPDNGWVCKQCQNYNFPGRTCCHRCKKVKMTDD